MEFPLEGRPEQDVRDALDEHLEGDLTYASGRIMGSMISAPHPFAEAVYREHLEKNVGDAGLFPATAALEREVVAMLGDLLGCGAATGHVLTGGTEANLVALWAARSLAPETRCRVLAPETAHVSWDKATHLLELELVRLPLTREKVLDVDAARRAIDERTLALVGVAGSTDLGMVDPIGALSALAVEHGIHLHVDAAFGGFVLPFLAGDPAPFDFRLPGVRTIAVNPHKMGLCPHPAGCLLFRDESIEQAVGFHVPYLAGGPIVQGTLVGTRSGASVIAVWAMLNHLGHAGYRRIVERCMDLTRSLADAVRSLDGFDVVVEPVMNIVGIHHERVSAPDLAEALRTRGWAVGTFPRHVRIVLLPTISAEHVRRFIEDLERVAVPARLS